MATWTYMIRRSLKRSPVRFLNQLIGESGVCPDSGNSTPSSAG